MFGGSLAAVFLGGGAMDDDFGSATGDRDLARCPPVSLDDSSTVATNWHACGWNQWHYQWFVLCQTFRVINQFFVIIFCADNFAGMEWRV